MVEVKLLKVVAPEMVLVEAVLKITVPELWVKVPLLVKLVPIVRLPEVETSVALAAMVTLPVTVMAGLLAEAVDPALVPSPIVRSPPTVCVPEPKTMAEELEGFKSRL